MTNKPFIRPGARIVITPPTGIDEPPIVIDVPELVIDEPYPAERPELATDNEEK